jgi:poly(3-hydroxybutyrate) depolymerase
MLRCGNLTGRVAVMSGTNDQRGRPGDQIRKDVWRCVGVARKTGKGMQGLPRMRSAAPGHVSPSSHLTEIENFGPNPGALRMFTYPPSDVSADCALMVVLHGCTQSAASYDLGAGWSTLAERFGFALLLPEQQRTNNPNGCFNWFQTGDIERGHGVALSVL